MNFPIWSDREAMPAQAAGSRTTSCEQLREFMRDNWNHPSVVLWDASNETHWDFLAQNSCRPCAASISPAGPGRTATSSPDAPDDPYEVHPYKFIDHVFGKKPPFFQMTDLEKHGPARKLPAGWQAQHAGDHQRIRLALAAPRRHADASQPESL